MPDSDETQADASAEKAYAQAAGNVAVVKAEPVEAVKPAEEIAKPATAVEIPSVKPKAASKAPAAKKPGAKPAPKAKAAPKTKSPPKPVSAPVAPKVKAAPKTKPAARKAPARAASLASISPKVNKPAKTATTTTPPASTAKKDTTMTISKKVTTGFESIISDAQGKAKEAFEKSSVLFGDYADFTKGNIEAVVQSGKILAEGLQGMSSDFVAESRSAFETASADIKGLAAAKSPTDLIQLQSEIVRKSFDNAVAYGSKNTEAMIKLTSEVFAPISSRMSLAVEKVRTASI